MDGVNCCWAPCGFMMEDDAHGYISAQCVLSGQDTSVNHGVFFLLKLNDSLFFLRTVCLYFNDVPEETNVFIGSRQGTNTFYINKRTINLTVLKFDIEIVRYKLYIYVVLEKTFELLSFFPVKWKSLHLGFGNIPPLLRFPRLDQFLDSAAGRGFQTSVH